MQVHSFMVMSCNKNHKNMRKIFGRVIQKIKGDIEIAYTKCYYEIMYTIFYRLSIEVKTKQV